MLNDITYCIDKLCIKKTCNRHPINLRNEINYVSWSDFKDCTLRDHGLVNLNKTKNS